MLIAHLLDEGAGDLDSQAFQRALDEKAIELVFHNDRDHLGGRMRTLSRTSTARPSCCASRSTRRGSTRSRSCGCASMPNARLRHEANDPARSRRASWRARAFPGHPYGQPSDGTLETLAADRARPTSSRAAKRMIARDELVDRGRRRDRRGGRALNWSTGRSPTCRPRAISSPCPRRVSRPRAVDVDDARRAAIDDPLRPPGSEARRSRLHRQRRAAHVLGGSGNMTVAPVPRGAREARPRL